MRDDMERGPERHRSDGPGSGHVDPCRTGPRPEPSPRAKAIGGGILDAGVAQRIVAAIRSMRRTTAKSAPLSGADLATLDAVTDYLAAARGRLGDVQRGDPDDPGGPEDRTKLGEGSALDDDLRAVGLLLKRMQTR
jgi:hypothetical protein